MDVDLYDSLAGQTALVTGANRGIGAQVAADLDVVGAAVYAGARDPDDVEAPDQRPLRLDVTDERQVEAATTTIGEERGGLDVLVNNAAVYGPAGRYGDLAPGTSRPPSGSTSTGRCWSRGTPCRCCGRGTVRGS